MAYPISPSSFPPPRSPPSVDSNFYHISFRNPVFISSQRNLQPRSFSLPVSRSPVSTICCCHRKSSEPSSPSDDGRWDLPLHQFLRIAVQKFDAFVKSRMNSQSTKNAAMEGNEQRQSEVEKLNVEEDDAGSWDWERWQKHFMEVEEQERLVDTLKSQLKHAVDNEDFEEAARLKVAIAAVATRNTVGSVMSFLNRALEEEQYKDAAFVRDNAGAGLVGWWAGVSDDNSDPYGCLIRISPEHGRYVARSYNPRQLATTKAGAPLFEIFMTMDKKGEYKQQAVYLKRMVASQSVASAFAKPSEATDSLKSLNPSLSITDLVDPAVPVIEDAAAADEDRDDSDADALSGFQNILQDMIPGVRVKVLKVIMPEKVDQDSVSKMIGQMMEEEDREKVAGLDGENLEDGDESDGGEQKDDIEVDAATKNIDHEEQSEIGIQVVVDGLVEKLPGSVLSKELLRVPAKLEKKGRKSFSLIINSDNNERVSGGKNLTEARRKAKGQQNAERLISDFAKLISRGEKIPPKVLKDVGNLIGLGISQAQNRQPLSRSTTFNRIELPAYSDPFNGLYVGSHGPFSSEVIQMRRRFGQWKEDSETKESSKLEFYEYVEAVKITGDPYVPAGQVAFRAKVGKRYQLPHKEIIPEEFGVIARYKGQGRLSGPGFLNPRWVDGELIVLDGKFIKAGPVVGFVYWAPENHFLVFFQRLRIQD